jgi:AcrR family transcriptional regulator
MRVTKDPETRREEILKAALELFREEGFEKVSVESIAKKVGVAKGSFYNYFKSKEEVFEAVIADTASQNLVLVKKQLTDIEIGPKERLVTYIDGTFHIAEQREKSLTRVHANPSQRQMYMRVVDEVNSQMFPLFVDILEQGVKVGEFDLPDPRFATVVMLGAFRGLHVAFYNDLQIDITTYRTYLYDFLSRLLGATF